MKKQKVCLVTGAGGKIGQKVLASLVSKGKKVLALAEPDDAFSPTVLNTHHIRINTALPVTNKSFTKHDVQFCFGDLSDISYLASIFSSADSNNIEIEYVIHLSANKEIQKTSPHAYHPDFGDTVNLLEVARAYWQANKSVFKGFFFASDNSNNGNDKIVQMLQKVADKNEFPVEIYKPESLVIGENYTGQTSLSRLYRFISPLKSIKTPKIETKSKKDIEKKYVISLLGAISNIIED